MITQGIVELIQFRDLLLTWTNRELRLRYKQTILGGLWAILQPVILMVLFVIVFSIFVRIPTEGIPYPIFAYTGLLSWTYFATALSFSSPSLVNNMTLVTKIYFPREIIPLATIGAALVDFGISSIVLVILMAYYRIAITPTVIWLPVLVLIQSVFIVGVVLFASMLNAFYRDIRFMIPLIIQAWMYATPVIYSLSSVPEWLRPIYLLNPMAGLVDSYRRVLLHGVGPEPIALSIATLVSFTLLFFGYRYFKSAEGILPDVI